jgi:DNA-directed RNA polymerase subunit RPC12/RpoP
MPLTEHMKQAGVTPQLMKTTKKITCPRCGHEFSLFQSRAIACKGCPDASFGCQKARCLRCDFEFPLAGPLVPNKYGQKYISGYMNNILDTYYKSVGKNPRR